MAFESGSANNIVKNTTISAMYAGVFLKAGSHDNHVLGNTLTNNNMMSPLDTTADNDAGAFGVVIWGSNNEVANNTISGSNACSYDYTLDGSAVEIYGGTANADASGNRIHHNKAINDNAFTELGKSSTAPSPDNNTYAYNTYFSSGISNGIFLVTRGSGSVFGPITHTKAYNNTAYITGSTKNGIYCGGTCNAIGDPANVLTFKNNIIATNNATPIPTGYGADMSNNIGWVVGSATNDPKFANAPAQDFHLLAGSAAIDTGIIESVNAGYAKDLDNHNVPAGSGVDVGSYEFGSVARSNGFSRFIAREAAGAAKFASGNWYKFNQSIARTLRKLTIQTANAAVPADASAATPCVGSPAPAQFKHVVVLMFENHQYSQVIGNPDAPYITNLAKSCATTTSWYDADFKTPGVRDGTYVSKPNYATLTTGVSPSVHGLLNDSSTTRTQVDNIYRQLRKAGKVGKDYYNAAGTGCGVSYGGSYHDAIRYFTGDAGADLAYCDAHDVSLSNFMPDVNAGALPDFSMILPDNCNNMHSCATVTNVIANGDTWAKNFLPQFLNSAQYKSGDTAIYFLWDEDSNIPNVLLAPSIVPGTAAPASSHFGALRTIEEMLGLPLLGVTGSHASEDLLSVFNGGGTPVADVTPPTVSISSPANGATVSGTVNVTATASDNVGVTKVDFYVDGALKSTTTVSPFTLALNTTTLLNGSHTLQAKAFDAAANQASSALVAVTVNNGCAAISAPNGQASTTVNVAAAGTYHLWSRIMAPDTTNNSYTFQTDGACNLTIGDSPIPANTWIWVDYMSANTATKADVTLTAGNHTLTLGGREVGVKLDRVLLLSDACIPTGTGDNCTTIPDTIAPTINITAPATGASVSSPIAVTATASDTGGSGVAKVDFTVDGVLQSSVNTPGPYTWTWTTTAVGSHTISAKATDGAGNVSTLSSVTVTILDTTKPVTTITGPLGGATVGGSAVAVTATANDNVGVASAVLSVDGIAYQTAPGNSVGNYGFTWNTSNFTNGAHSLQVQAKDAAGNTANSAAVAVTVANDTTAPSQPTNLTASAVSSTQVNVSWTASTDNIGVTGYEIQRGGVAIAQTPNTTYTDNTVVSGTAYSYTIVATDAAGNRSQASIAAQVTTPQTLDTTPPTAPVNLLAQAISQNQVNLSWGASTDTGGSGLSGYSVARNGAPIATVTTTTFTDGTVQASTAYSYTITATDGAGNVSVASNSASVTTPAPPPPADTTAPVASITTPTAGQTISGTSTVSANVTDNTSLARVAILVDGVERASILSPAQGAVSLSWATSLVADGVHTLVITATDPAGNPGSSPTVSVTVKNNVTPPPATTKTLSFAPAADSKLKLLKPDTNYGTSASMRVDNSPHEKTIMKFNVSGVTGRVTRAVIRLYCQEGSTATGGTFYYLPNSWAENTVTWNNAPYFYTLPSIASLPGVAAGTYVDIPVSAKVQSDGTYSFGGRSSNANGATYSTKEDATTTHRPRLIITESL